MFRLYCGRGHAHQRGTGGLKPPCSREGLYLLNVLGLKQQYTRFSGARGGGSAHQHGTVEGKSSAVQRM
jgi:hypothetical protein